MLIKSYNYYYTSIVFSISHFKLQGMQHHCGPLFQSCEPQYQAYGRINQNTHTMCAYPAASNVNQATKVGNSQKEYAKYEKKFQWFHSFKGASKKENKSVVFHEYANKHLFAGIFIELSVFFSLQGISDADIQVILSEHNKYRADPKTTVTAREMCKMVSTMCI